MNCNWKCLFVKVSLWIASEIILNCVGLDMIADYSEFLQAQQDAALRPPVVPVLIAQA